MLSKTVRKSNYQNNFVFLNGVQMLEVLRTKWVLRDQTTTASLFGDRNSKRFLFVVETKQHEKLKSVSHDLETMEIQN